MQATLLSVLVPVYNEEEFVGALLERVIAAPLPAGMRREIIVVDDGSTDASAEVVEEIAAFNPDIIKLVRHGRNRGKGAAIRTAIEYAAGDLSVIQDADLEYDPREYVQMLRPLLEGKADVVYGSRFVTSGERRVLYFWHAIANGWLTGLCNLVADLNLTDMGTCYKMFRTSLLRSIPLRSNGFGVEPEITIKLARREVRFYETPISYHGRTYAEGKKVGIHDAVAQVLVILRFAWTHDIYRSSGPEVLEAFSNAPRFNRWMADVIRPYVGKHVLEIGAGIGNLTRLLVSHRRRYVASDIDREHLARLESRFQHRPNLDVRSCDLSNPEDFRALSGDMDSVVCLNVLEHTEDDLAGLRNIHSCLKPGGRAIILVPHGQEIYGTLDQVLGHYRRYSHQELREKMELTGFRVEHILDFNRISRPAWYISGSILKRTTVGHFQLKLFDRLVWLWRRIDRWLPWGPTSIIAIGVKV